MSWRANNKQKLKNEEEDEALYTRKNTESYQDYVDRIIENMETIDEFNDALGIISQYTNVQKILDVILKVRRKAFPKQVGIDLALYTSLFSYQKNLLPIFINFYKGVKERLVFYY